ncbi:MAG: PIG-L family deacetylase, partial [Actinomycetota bacterium]|nr:PIG-L family deacetylase [Actinomycetota bacterium]
LATRRRQELMAAAGCVGAARVELLGYADSGLDGQEGGAGSFARTAVDEAAGRLAEVLREERADVLTVYDEAGGYGHPDHRQVRRVGMRAAALAGTPVVLEATVDRRLIKRAARLVAWLPGLPPEFAPSRFDSAYTASEAITHCVDVRHFSAAKRAAMAAHVSQGTADAGVRTLAVFLRLPRPLFTLVFGREWFVEIGRAPGPVLDDIFATSRSLDRYGPTAGD